jgi:hypothetical protein
MSSIQFPHQSALVNERLQEFMGTLAQCQQIHEENKKERDELKAQEK